MKILVYEHSNLVVAFGNEATIVDNGINLDNVIYAEPELTAYDVESLPDDYDHGKYCYTIERGFYSFDGYSPYVPEPIIEPVTPEEKRLRDIEDAILALALQGGMF